MGQEYSIDTVRLLWETAYGKAYKIQVSNDNINWNDVYSTSSGDGGIDNITFEPVNARYIRVYGIERGLIDCGYSIFEFQVYGN
ncbi:hypothetical protein SH1V18_32530 [Vallitalea longa]|uniref:F5/8 type C domain-containing protein n=1 Tax=Vallitalea longa TaxID=2936439 RepID=A0A9W5YEB9_9FIRM|nr:hypothetical protein SH1V18_32530 [Vallitalea longa]